MENNSQQFFTVLSNYYASKDETTKERYRKQMKKLLRSGRGLTWMNLKILFRNVVEKRIGNSLFHFLLTDEEARDNLFGSPLIDDLKNYVLSKQPIVEMAPPDLKAHWNKIIGEISAAWASYAAENIHPSNLANLGELNTNEILTNVRSNPGNTNSNSANLNINKYKKPLTRKVDARKKRSRKQRRNRRSS